MKIPSSVKKLLENKYVLYIVFFLAVANLFGYMVMGNYKAIALFVLVGYLVHNFNKNMILVLGVPLILTSLFTSGFIREGADSSDGLAAAKAASDKAAADKAAATAATSAAAAAASPDDKALAEKAAADKAAATTAAATAADSAAAADKAAATTAAAANSSPADGSADTASGNSLKVGTVGSDFVPASTTNVTVSGNGAAVVPGMDATGAPKPNESVKAPFSNPYDKKGSRLDYAATVEDAYGDLNNILGGDGIKNLTADTQKLMEQQLQLANAMKSMTPLLEQAKSLIGGFDMKNFGNITEMAKQFKASGSN
jgi:hypothetical protein